MGIHKSYLCLTLSCRLLVAALRKLQRVGSVWGLPCGVYRLRKSEGVGVQWDIENVEFKPAFHKWCH